MQPETPEKKPESQELPAHGSPFIYRGKTLLSRIDPAGQAERIIEKLAIKERTLYFCPSPLYGYGISLLLNKLGKNSAVLCAEADDDLFSLSCDAMKPLLNENSDRLLLAKTGTGKNAKAGINAEAGIYTEAGIIAEAGSYTGTDLCTLVNKTWGERRFRRIEIIKLTGGWQLFQDLYKRIADALRKDMAVSWGNAMTLIKLGRLYIRNAVRNLPALAKENSIKALNFHDDPILVLGAGPSMDLILDGIPEISGRRAKGNNAKDSRAGNNRPFRIICADTCLTSLAERGIEPDLAVILESQHWNLRDFLNVKNRKINAAVDLSALPGSVNILGGGIFFFMTPWTELRLFDRLEQTGLLPPPLTPLGSVGLTAVELALRIGKGPVIAAGLDFSFTMDAYHARSSPGHLARLAGTSRLRSLLNAETAFREGTFPALSKSGLMVRSDPAMRNYLNLFREEFSAQERIIEIQGPGLSLGARIASVKEAVNILTGSGKTAAEPASRTGAEETADSGQYIFPNEKKAELEKFIRNEQKYLLKLKDILTGRIAAEPAEIENLLDVCDYLWSHFPECAAAGGRRPESSDLSFLKRVRMEIDPFLKLWEENLSGLLDKSDAS